MDGSSWTRAREQECKADSRQKIAVRSDSVTAESLSTILSTPFMEPITRASRLECRHCGQKCVSDAQRAEHNRKHSQGYHFCSACDVFVIGTPSSILRHNSSQIHAAVIRFLGGQGAGDEVLGSPPFASALVALTFANVQIDHDLQSSNFDSANADVWSEYSTLYRARALDANVYFQTSLLRRSRHDR